ncbi:hypothetical protein B0T24DRAFT_606243 [Lasiosphaeria ovina]|uniref:Uncharacterized protein n=1 Tax=Lasiosphaeria ovina TaxID=92902 RepID=A0AAE0TY59_9PEZI|nr:hypothetical protein B0T24DRAFT_606243 [Lasiosphaeria ovina]
MCSLPVILGMGIPQCVQALPQSPPTCLPSQGDQSANKLLEDFGTEVGASENEIAQASNLASGSSDVVVILERPSSAASRNTSFEGYLRDCKSLQALDEVTRFATKEARSIRNRTVLDAFSYQPDKNNNDRDAQCHRLLAQILQVKKPRVVIRCHRDSYQDEWMGRFDYFVDDYQMEREDVDFGDGHTAVLIQSFHPSCAVNNAEFRPEYRALLIHHFIAAFAELRGKHELPEVVEDIRQLCLKKGQRSPKDTTNFASWEAAAFISRALEMETKYSGPEGSFPVEWADDGPYDRFRNRERHLDGMYDWLQRLAENSCTCGALAIAKAMAYWEHHFSDDPLYDQVMDLLRLHGGQQFDWFSSPATADSKTAPEMSPSLEVQFSQLTIDTSAPKTPPGLSESVDRASKAAAPLRKAEFPENMVEDTTKDMILSMRAGIVRDITAHNTLVKDWLRRSPVEFARAVRIAKHLRQWDEYTKVVQKDEGLIETGIYLGYCSDWLRGLGLALRGLEGVSLSIS